MRTLLVPPTFPISRISEFLQPVLTLLPPSPAAPGLSLPSSVPSRSLLRLALELLACWRNLADRSALTLRTWPSSLSTHACFSAEISTFLLLGPASPSGVGGEAGEWFASPSPSLDEGDSAPYDRRELGIL